MRFLVRLSFLLALLSSSPATAQGYTPDDDLLYRINFGSAEDVRLLLAKGANPDARSKQGELALDMALERNDAESAPMAAALIEKGANVDATDKSGNSPLIYALKYKRPSVVKMLLAKDANFHVFSAEGMPLIEYAKLHGDAESIKAIQQLIDKEDAYSASLSSPDRFQEIVQLYAMDSCTFQYWSYYLSSRQNPEKDPETQKRINKIKESLAQLVTQIQKYYAPSSLQSLRDISAQAVQGIYNVLDAMISNRNRAENGVGQEQDANDRCKKIVDRLHIDFIPVVLNKAPAVSPAPPTATPQTHNNIAAPVAPLLPLDPAATSSEPKAR